MRVAVVGCGRIATVYSKAFAHIGSEVQVVMAFDKVLSRAQAFAVSFPGCIPSDATTPEQVAELLKENGVELVNILLPHHLHCAYTVAALDAGINVLTEKPIATTAEDAELMMAARDRSGCQLGVIFQNRFIDGVQKVHQLIHDGELGKLQGAYSNLNWFRPASYYQCDWKGCWATEGGGVVIDQAIHSIDLVRYMTGLNAVKIMGHTSRRVLTTIEVEDEADAAIILEDGSIYSFFACNYYASNSPIRIELTYEKAVILLTRETIEITWKDGRGTEIIKPDPSLNPSGEDYWGCFHEVQLRETYRAFREKRQIPWTAEDAKKTLDIVLGIYESARVNALVTLDL